MDDLLKKLHETGDVSFGSFVDGKLIDSNDYTLAIKSGEAAAEAWKNNQNRYSILSRISEGLRSKISAFLEVTSLCSYKYRDTIISDLEYAISGFDYFTKLSRKNNITESGFCGRGIIGAAVLEECALFSTLSWLIAAPLAAGNTIVLLVKPSYSIIALYFVSSLHEFGIPKGVLNVVPFIESGKFPEIASHLPSIIGLPPANLGSSSKLNFSSGILKKPKSCPVLVLKSADIDSVIDTFINLSKNQEVIWFPNVIYVEEPIYQEFLTSLQFIADKNNYEREKLIEDGIYSRKTLDKFIDEKRGQGYEVIELIHHFSNCYILVNNDFAVDNSCIVDENDVVHRIVSLLPIRTTSEGLKYVNDTPGMAVSVWSNDAVDVIRLPSSLKYGTVWINSAALYSPSVPLSLWHDFGYGTFSGKRAFYEVMTKSNLELFKNTSDSLYAADRNVMFIKKDVSSVISQMLNVQSSWFKSGRENRSKFLENVSKIMNQNWNNHYKIVLGETSQSSWKKSISYLEFWSCYIFENTFDQFIETNSCKVICKSEPLGVIAIVASSAPLEALMFLIAAAVAYGNSVIVGLSSDEKSSITASELEKIFCDKPHLVNIVVNSTNSLWQQFISNNNIACVWFMENYCNSFTENYSFKNIMSFKALNDMTQSAMLFEVYGTRAKAIWLPGA